MQGDHASAFLVRMPYVVVRIESEKLRPLAIIGRKSKAKNFEYCRCKLEKKGVELV